MDCIQLILPTVFGEGGAANKIPSSWRHKEREKDYHLLSGMVIKRNHRSRILTVGGERWEQEAPSKLGVRISLER